MNRAMEVGLVAFGSLEHLSDLAYLSAAGRHIPHHYRWSANPDARWCRVSQGDQLISGFALDVGRRRLMPGMRIVRIERFGREFHEPLLEVLPQVLHEVRVRIPRVLRLHVELFDEEPARADRFAGQLLAAGFVESSDPRTYPETLRVRLDGPAEAVFKRFSASTRRNIASVNNAPLRVSEIEGVNYLPRIETLFQQAFQRTDSAPPRVDFAAILQNSQTDSHSRFFGMFAHHRSAPEDLVAFAWVRSHGDYVSYDLGASERASDLGRTPLTYSLLWRAIQWSIERAHHWFDMGGVTPEGAPTDHPLSGISAFKIGFSSDRVRVGREFLLEPNTLLGRLANRIGSLVS